MTVRSTTYDANTGEASMLAFAEEPPGGTRLLSSLDVRSLWRILLWRARLIGAVAVGIAVLTAATLVIVPPKYKGTTILLVDPRQPRVTNSEAVLAGIGADAAAVESQVELIQSSALARKVIAKLDLASDQEFASASLTERIKDGLLTMLGRAPADSTEERINRLVYRFQSGLSVHRRGLTYILEVSYFSQNAEKAARISGAVAEAYLDDQRSAKREVTARASGWLGDRIEEMRERVRRAERAVADYRSANRLVDVTQGNKLVARQMEDITQQLALARSRKAEAQGRLERAQEARRQVANPAALAALGEVLQSQVIGNLRTQYAEAARLEAEYSALYGTRYPALVAVRAQLADLRRQIDREIERVVAGVRNDYEVSASREAALEAELAKLKEQSESFGQADVALRELEREAQAERALFEQFLSRAKETNEQQTLQIADARIVSPALTPIKAERPAAALLLVVAAACGLLFGVALVLLMERLRRGLRSATEVEQFVGMSNLGILPQQTEGKTGGFLSRSAATTPRAAAVRYAINFPASDYAASLWAIMARLRRSAPAGASEVLVVASALPGEGKSTFAANLSLAFASTGVRTLLIDADVYAAETTRAFGLKGPGLCEILQGKAQLAGATAKDVKTGLYVLGAREASLRAGDLKDIDEKSIAAVLADCRKHFDVVVIDSPAILPVDGGAFLEFADRAILMVEWERTERAAVLDALAILGQHKSKLTGVVLNKASPRWYRLFDCGRYLRYYSAGIAPIPAAAPPQKSAA